jgi:hypothetical protein
MRTIHSKTRIPVLLCLGLLLMCAETLLAQRVQILNATNTLWRYHPNSTDPGYSPADAWVDPAYDDSTWSGPSRGLFGTEAAGIYPYPIVTSIPSPSGSGGALVSSYFRVHFNWTAHPQGVELIFTNYVDDGLLVYLNGVELWAWNMPAERPVPWNISTLPGAANPIPEPSILMTNITANLIQGDNVLAVQLQQHGTGSSDDVFGMWMWGVTPFPPTNRVDTQPTNRIVLQSRPTTLSAVIDGSPTPTYQWYKDGAPIDPAVNPTATNANLVISQMSAADAGDYYAIGTNPAGSVQTRTATVGYTADLVAPRTVRAVGSPTFTTITIEYDEGMDPFTVTDAVNYAVSPPLTVLSADLAPNGSSVILTTAEQQAPDTAYTVTALNVYDLAGNNIAAPNNTAQFRSWIPAANCSGVLFEAFSSTMTTIALFTNSANYPNNPYTNLFIQGMHSRMAFPANNNENYGGRMRALFIPLVSGNWRLYMSSDDPGELWFNPNGGSPAGRQRVAFETACCQLYQPAGRNQTSPNTFPLVAGQGYYIELIYKENAGGDYGMVAARLENDGIPTGGNDQGAEAGEAISGTVAPSRFATTGFGAVPAGAAGTLSINQNLSNVSSEANRQVTLTVGASAPNSPYICYQWQRSDDNGVTFNDIPDATRATYVTPYLTQADDNGDIYRVVTGIPGTSITSATARLTVTADVTAPRITRIVPISPTQIAVYFSEPMPPPSSATDAFSYEIDQGVQVGEALQNPTNVLRVDLTLSAPMTVGNTYLFRGSTPLTQLVDPSGNAVNPNPTLISFQSLNFTGNPDAIVDLPTNSRRPIGSLTQRGFAVRVVQIGAAIVNQISIAEQMLSGQYIDAGTGQPYPNLAATPNFTEANVVDYYGNGTDTGHVLPNAAIPGLPSTAVNFALEVLTYLELQPGLYRMGVNSDDNFRVSPATRVTDPNNAITIGTFDGSGGRAQGDTFFEFSVPEAGLYPFRLVFEQGTGGWGLEWFVQSMIDSSFTLVNGTDEIKAFVPSTAPRLNVARNAGNVTISWTESGTLQQASEIAGPWTDSLNQSNPQTFAPQGKRFFRIRP